MTRKARFCPTCGASKCYQRWRPHAMTDYSHELVDDARLSHMNTADVFKCPSCGLVGCVVEYHQNGGGFWDLDIPCDCEPRFCPECGARVVVE